MSSLQMISFAARRSFVFVSGLRQSVQRYCVETPKPAAVAASVSASTRPNSANHKVDNLERKVRENEIKFNGTFVNEIFEIDVSVDWKV